MPEQTVGGAMAVWVHQRGVTPDEHLESMIRTYVERNNPGVRDITTRWSWSEAFGWEDDEGNLYGMPAHWMLFAEGTIDV